MELADGPRAGGARGHRAYGVDSLIAGLLRTAVGYSGVLSLSVSVDVVARQRHAAPTTKVWSCRRFWELRCAGGDGAGGWTSGWRGEGPPRLRGRFLIAGLLRTAVGVSGVLSLSVSVDVVARQRHAAPTTKVWSCRRFWELRCAGGDGAGGWTSGWRGEGPPRYGVDSLIAGLLRTAVWYSGVLSLSVSVDVVARQRHAAPTTKVWSCRRFWELRCAGGDGAGGWTSGWRGEGPPRYGVDSLIAGLLRTAVWYSGVLSLSVSVDVVARQRHAAPTTKVWSCRRFWELRCAGGDGAGGWTSGWRGEGPPSVRGSIP